MKKIFLKKNGFTLIELLIVISIIGVLASLLMANFIGVRQRARDAQRKADLRQMQAALELYRADIGTYPYSELSVILPSGVCLDEDLEDEDCNNTVYMQEIPKDPMGDDQSYNSGDYCYDDLGTSGARYYILSCLENSNDSQGTLSDDLPTDMVDCSPSDCSSGFFYLVKNP